VGVQQGVSGPYTAVVFVSRRRGDSGEEYAAVSRRMDELVRAAAGYLGMESVRGAEGVGITVSYWADRASAARWKNVVEHRAAQEAGKDRFYGWYRVRICRVEEEYTFDRGGASDPGPHGSATGDLGAF
jgi:heme-degrading monooxygenase HmoA